MYSCDGNQKAGPTVGHAPFLAFAPCMYSEVAPGAHDYGNTKHYSSDGSPRVVWAV